MAAAAVLIERKGFIPSINTFIDELTTEGWAIRSIALDILGHPLTEISEPLMARLKIETKVVGKCNPSFVKEDFLKEVTNAFREFTNMAKRFGTFGKLRCQLDVVITRPAEDQATLLRKGGMEMGTLEKLDSAQWQQDLFGVAAATPQPKETETPKQ